jgi:undecaprenyl-diphosphatase
LSSIERLDDRLFLEVNRYSAASGWLHTPAADFATYGLVLFAALLLIGYLVARRGRPRALAASVWAGVGTLLAVGANQPLGRAVHEARPYSAHPDALVLVARTADFSFPSDHAVMAGGVAAGLLLVTRGLGALAGLAAAVMAADRVYVGAHYPWDVVAGLAFGAAVVLLGWLLVRSPLTLLVRHAREHRPLRLLLGPAG